MLTSTLTKLEWFVFVVVVVVEFEVAEFELDDGDVNKEEELKEGTAADVEDIEKLGSVLIASCTKPLLLLQLSACTLFKLFGLKLKQLAVVPKSGSLEYICCWCWIWIQLFSSSVLTVAVYRRFFGGAEHTELLLGAEIIAATGAAESFTVVGSGGGCGVVSICLPSTWLIASTIA